MTADDAVPSPTGPRLALLKRLGFGELTHDSHVPFLSHLLGTRRLLVEWGERPAMCDAGLFHSAYGTEYFPVDRPVDRRVDLPDQLLADIATLWAADTVEQIARMTPEERAFSHGLRQVLHLARPAAQAAAQATTALIDER